MNLKSYFHKLSKMESPAISIDKLFQIEEEAPPPPEPNYAGLTAASLRRTIINLATNATLNMPVKYKAAVTIQAAYKGWKTRVQVRKWKQKAIEIQKIWRGYHGRCRYFEILENQLRVHLETFYDRAATKIQAAFRGHYSRQYRHDQVSLRKLRLQSASELLQCVAIKTRELLKNQQLPGVYSLRNSSCLSKVEKLMASLKVRTFNIEVRRARAEEVKKLRRAFEKSLRSKEETQLPFGTLCKKRAAHMNL